MLSCFSRVRLFATLWTVVHQACSPWDFAGKKTGMGFHFLLQGIFLSQGLNPCLLCLLYCRQILYHWATRETQHGILLSHWEEWSNAICSNIDGPGEYHTKRNKPDRKINILWYHLYVESKKMIQLNLFTKQKQTHRIREWTYGYHGEYRGEEQNGSLGLTCTHCYF